MMSLHSTPLDYPTSKESIANQFDVSLEKPLTFQGDNALHIPAAILPLTDLGSIPLHGKFPTAASESV